jgi:outer membrane protein OmpA-like peptidoglycan-associated protein
MWVGHTDNVGGYDYNLKLSQARAGAVVKELVTKYKVAPERLKAAGVGRLSPVASNDTEEGRAKNRRVELVKQ